MATGPTRSQINFINKLTEQGAERLEVSEKFLKKLGKGSVSELTVQEASSLIEKLKSVKVEGSDMSNSGGPTQKQLKFIGNLQNSEERIAFTTNFLKKRGKGTYNELNLSEASSLIDGLMEIKKGASNDSPKEFLATPKQIIFIKNLLKTERENKIVSEYLKGIGKGSLEMLNRHEASSLIERLTQ